MVQQQDAQSRDRGSIPREDPTGTLLLAAVASVLLSLLYSQPNLSLRSFFKRSSSIFYEEVFTHGSKGLLFSMHNSKEHPMVRLFKLHTVVAPIADIPFILEVSFLVKVKEATDALCGL